MTTAYYAGVAAVLATFASLVAAGGRGFPVEAENFAVDHFKQLNPSLEWDASNFLVDVAGRYARCNNVGRRGPIDIDRTTPDGARIGGLADYVRGSDTDSEATTRYITDALQGWVNNPTFSEKLRRADKFGCSVRPGCSDNVVMVCLYTPA